MSNHKHYSDDVVGVNPLEELLIKPLYTQSDLAGNPYVDTLLGEAPFIRGPQATMYTGKPWTIRQYGGVLEQRPSRTHSTGRRCQAESRALVWRLIFRLSAVTTPITHAR